MEDHQSFWLLWLQLLSAQSQIWQMILKSEQKKEKIANGRRNNDPVLNKNGQRISDKRNSWPLLSDKRPSDQPKCLWCDLLIAWIPLLWLLSRNATYFHRSVENCSCFLFQPSPLKWSVTVLKWKLGLSENSAETRIISIDAFRVNFANNHNHDWVADIHLFITFYTKKNFCRSLVIKNIDQSLNFEGTVNSFLIN